MCNGEIEVSESLWLTVVVMMRSQMQSNRLK